MSGISASKAFASVGLVLVVFGKMNPFCMYIYFSDTSEQDSRTPDRSYPGVNTQSQKYFYRFTDFSMPQDYTEQPSGSQVLSYLSV